MNNYLEIDGLCIAYSEAGSPANPPVILVHGITSHRGVWTQTMAVLQEHFHCIALDFPGFGDSEKPANGDYCIATQAERILKVADRFGFDRFILIGHSMGGQIATYLASTLAPQRVVKLVSVDGVVTGELSSSVQNFKRLLIVAGKQIPALYQSVRVLCLWKPAACLAFDHWYYRPADLPFEAWAADRFHATDAAIAQSTSAAWASLNATDLTSLVEKITAPTLVLFGAQDGTVPVEQAHLFKKKMPAAKLVLIERCGHFPMYENFEAFIQPVKEFLQSR